MNAKPKLPRLLSILTFTFLIATADTPSAHAGFFKSVANAVNKVTAKVTKVVDKVSPYVEQVGALVAAAKAGPVVLALETGKTLIDLLAKKSGGSSENTSAAAEPVEGGSYIATVDAKQTSIVGTMENEGSFVGSRFRAVNSTVGNLKLYQGSAIEALRLAQGGSVIGNNSVLSNAQAPGSLDISQEFVGGRMVVSPEASVVGNNLAMSGRLGDLKISQLTKFAALNAKRGTTIGCDFSLSGPVPGVVHAN